MQIPTMFKEADGKLSYSRIIPALIVLGFLPTAMKVGWITGVFPDIPTNWMILAGSTFVGGKAVAKSS